MTKKDYKKRAKKYQQGGGAMNVREEKRKVRRDESDNEASGGEVGERGG